MCLLIGVGGSCSFCKPLLSTVKSSIVANVQGLTSNQHCFVQQIKVNAVRLANNNVRHYAVNKSVVLFLQLILFQCAFVTSPHGYIVNLMKVETLTSITSLYMSNFKGCLLRVLIHVLHDII